MTSARTKPFWMSVWISPAACQAVRPSAQVPGLRGLGLAGGEERDQLQQLEGAADDALQAGLADAEVRAHRRGVLVVELGQLGLQAAETATAPAPWAAACSAIAGGTSSSPSSTLATNSTGLAVSGERLRSASGASAGTGTRARRPAGLQRVDHRAQPASSAIAALSPPRACAHDALVAALGLLEVGVDQLGLDRLDVARRVDAPSGWTTAASLWARTTWTIASVSRMLARNWLPRPSPSCAPRDEAGDVVEGDRVRDDLRGADVAATCVEPLVAHRARRRRWARSS